MNKRQARIEALGGLTAAVSCAAEGYGDAFPQYNNDGKQWTEQEFDQLRKAFAALHEEFAQRLARLERSR
jgi:thymidylate synthase